ncbi:MAG: biotin transporter BioY [Roseiarcus sp.]|jgi:biotin transport system substrate-specific component
MNDAILNAARPLRRATGLTQAGLVLAGVAILTASAKFQVPFWPAPMTMQTLAVLMLGAAYGARLGSGTVIAYLALGAAGAPVFAAGGGAAYFVGPTGGYLVGFALAAFVVGSLIAQRPRASLVGAFAVVLAGDAIIFGCGVGWLAVLFGAGKALAYGLAPFALAELLKLALGASLIVGVRRLRRA